MVFEWLLLVFWVVVDSYGWLRVVVGGYGWLRMVVGG